MEFAYLYEGFLTSSLTNYFLNELETHSTVENTCPLQ